MKYEIGSHFEFDNKHKVETKGYIGWLPDGSDSAYTFSGRTAIELAIKDIKLERQVESVYMPSYCCDSMIEPFIKNNVKVLYYDVNFEGNEITYDINLDTECDIFFAMSYFGLEKFKQDFEIESFAKQGKVVIEDVTHRLMCNEPYSKISDYNIA